MASGIRPSCASPAGASSGCGMGYSRRWRALGLPPTRNMPSIPQLCGRTNMPPAQKGESKSGSARPLARRLLHENPPSHDPLTFDVTGGEVHEVKGYDALMQLHEIDPAKLIGDKGYDSDGIRNDLAERGIEPVIPPRSNRKTPIEYDREAYKRRNLIERCVNRLKQFRRIATRYEKTARAYLSMLCIAAAKLWIKTVNTA